MVVMVTVIKIAPPGLMEVATAVVDQGISLENVQMMIVPSLGSYPLLLVKLAKNFKP